MKIHGNESVDNRKLMDNVKDLSKNQDVEKKGDAQQTESDKDKVSLSGKAQEVNDLKAMINDLPEIRQDKVDALKKAIDSGSYNFDSLKVAQRILVEEFY